VVDLHSVKLPGHDIGSLRRKCTSIHQKKVPTGDLNMPDEVHLVKKVKYMIGDRAQLEGGEHDMLSDHVDGGGG